MLGAVGPVESEIEEATWRQDPADVGQALADHVARRVREDTMGVHDGKMGRRQEAEGQIADNREMGKLCLQAGFSQGALPVQQDFRGDVQAVVIAGLQIVDKEPAGAQVAAADFQHPIGWPQPVLEQVIEL
jgi:hypothetical protein